MAQHFPTVRVYPRLMVGGAERDILELLAGISGTHMVVTHVEGHAAGQAQASAARYTLLGEAKFAPLVRAAQESSIVHLHTINDHPLLPFAACLADPDVLVQTVHNDLAADACQLVDWSFLSSRSARDIVATPGRSQHLPSGVRVPKTLSPKPPWFSRGEPLTLVEVRRPEKAMAWTLEDLFATGRLDGLDARGIVVGLDEPSSDPRVLRVGVQADPSAWLERADLCVVGSAVESFGRVPIEAAAVGTLSLVTDLPAFTENLKSSVRTTSFDATEAAQALVDLTREWRDDPDRYAGKRFDAHGLTVEHFSSEAMVVATRERYERLLSAPRRSRSLCADDVGRSELDAFGDVIDRLCTRRELPRPMPVLSSRALGVLAWALAHYGWAPPERRLDLLEDAARALGPRPIVALDLGLALRDAGRLDQAESWIATSVAAAPDNVHGHLALIDVRARSGRSKSTLQAAESLLRHVPDFAGAAELRSSLMA